MSPGRRLLVLMLVLTGLWCAAPNPALAHPTPGSLAVLDFTVEGAQLEQDVPIEELERALKQRLSATADSAEAVVDQHREQLRAYARNQVQITTEGQRQPWLASVVEVTGHTSSDGPRAKFRMVFEAPGGDASGTVLLHDGLVTHEVISHSTTVFLRSDWSAGNHELPTTQLGVLSGGRTELRIQRRGSFFQGLREMTRVGADHVLDGSDHLLFLLSMVLVAPVMAVAGKWERRSSARSGMLEIAKIATAFTFGHSLTLALAAFEWVVLPSALVEALIAVSILVAAGHAYRPCFARWELLVAGLFGLIHGLAFASSLSGRGLGAAQLTWTLLAFNVGVELAQLLVLALVVPWLLLLSQSEHYGWFRRAFAVLAFVLGCSWLIERTSSFETPLAPLMAVIEHHRVTLLVVLAVVTLLVRATSEWPRHTST